MNSHVDLEIQRILDSGAEPADDAFRLWAEATLQGRRSSAQLVIRIVDEVEISTLNRNYRGREGPTNVLSFPFEAPPPVQSDLLGDLVICAPLVGREAAGQDKVLEAHWAHMVVHGILHLLGFDHIRETEAAVMESVEREILAGLGYPDPYAGDEVP